MNFLGLVALAYCVIVWGTTFFIVKDSVPSLHPVALVGYRFIISAVLMFVVLLAAKRKNIFANFKPAFFLSVLLFSHYVSQTYGLGMTTAVNGGFIAGLFVLFVPIFLKLFFGDKITAVQWFACILSVVGLWILTGGIRGFNAGDALVFLSAPFYGAFLVFVDRYLRKGVDILSFVFNQFLATGIMSFAACFIFNFDVRMTDTKTVVSIFYLAVFATFGTYFAQLWAQKRIEPVRVGIIISLVPVSGALFSWFYGKEPFKLSALVGGLIILSAVFISESRRRNALDK